MSNRITTVWLALLVAFLWSCGSTGPQVDVLLLGGQVIDGSGRDATVMDVGIQGDSIVFLGDAKSRKIKATKKYKIDGYTLSPGFIDVHTHTLNDLLDAGTSSNLPYLRQGVTTVVTGNDGNSRLDVAAVLDQWQSQGIGTNAGLLVGHRTVRRKIMGMRDAPASPDEIAQMSDLIRTGMEAGALGLSTGLFYAPASFASTDELIQLARISGAYGGIFDIHLRDESSYGQGLVSSVREAISIGRGANIPTNISHIKCLGADVWGQSAEIIELIEAAQFEEDLRITADQYPYLASGTHLSRATLPSWFFANTTDVSKRIADPTMRVQLEVSIRDNIRRRGGPASIRIVNGANPAWNGQTIQSLYEAWSMDPVDVVIKLIAEGDAAIASFNMQDSDVEAFLQRDWVMTASDGTVNHPRKYGSFPRKLRRYVQEQQLISLPEMIQRSSYLPAQTFGIPKRGLIAPGYKADILVFKPDALKDNATFDEPELLATGIHLLFVNGQLVVRNDAYLEVKAGQVVRKPGKIRP